MWDGFIANTFRVTTGDQLADEVFELGDALLDGRLQGNHPGLFTAAGQGIQVTNGLNGLKEDQSITLLRLHFKPNIV